MRQARGDQVRKGDVLAVIETDKAAMEMEAYDEGVLARILVQEGAWGAARDPRADRARGTRPDGPGAGPQPHPGRAVRRHLVRDDQVTLGTAMALTLSIDHRAVDGATGAGFLTRLKS